MKINWGTGVVLAFISFIAFIMYFIITMSVNNKYQHDLVTEEYYKKELAFQKQIDKQQRAKNLGLDLNINKTKNGLMISFPKKLSPSEVSGTIYLYRPSSQKLDFRMPISLSGYDFLIPKKHLLEGRWNIEIDWVHKGGEYFYKEEFTY